MIQARFYAALCFLTAYNIAITGLFFSPMVAVIKLISWYHEVTKPTQKTGCQGVFVATLETCYKF